MTTTVSNLGRRLGKREFTISFSEEELDELRATSAWGYNGRQTKIDLLFTPLSDLLPEAGKVAEYFGDSPAEERSKQRRSRQLEIALDQQQHRELVKRAKLLRLPAGTYARRVLLGKSILPHPHPCGHSITRSEQPAREHALVKLAERVHEEGFGV